jgi:uncharacterized membrane protein YhaH (DUF805 family)
MAAVSLGKIPGKYIFGRDKTMEQYWKWFLEVLKTKYMQFSGRAHREEYWSYVLVWFLISIGLVIVGRVIGSGFIGDLIGLGMLLPSLAAAARRLHDTDRSGWWQLIAFIPVIGWIILIVFLAQEGQTGENRYGSDPRTAA